MSDHRSEYHDSDGGPGGGTDRRDQYGADHYGILQVEPGASEATIRKAFRARLLEVHPDKAIADSDPALLDAVMLAFEILGNRRRRDEYDRRRKLRERHRDPLDSIPHVTESERPSDRARAILYLLVTEKPDDALVRMELLEEDPLVFLSQHLDDEELIDASFLLAERLERLDQPFEALRWYQALIQIESRRRRHRPCYEEAVDRARRLLIQTISTQVDPRTSLEYLRRAEKLGLDRPQRADVLKRRAQAYLDLDMRVEAAKQLRLALETLPSLKGVRRLRDELGV